MALEYPPNNYEKSHAVGLPEYTDEQMIMRRRFVDGVLGELDPDAPFASTLHADEVADLFVSYAEALERMQSAKSTYVREPAQLQMATKLFEYVMDGQRRDTIASQLGWNNAEYTANMRRLARFVSFGIQAEQDPAKYLRSGERPTRKTGVWDYSEPLLNRNEERELGKDIEAGLYARHLLGKLSVGESITTTATPAELDELATVGEAAFNRFVRANIRLARWYINRNLSKVMQVPDFNSFTDARNDLMPELMERGVTHAIRKYDYTYAENNGFAGYALYTLRPALNRALAARQPIAHSAKAYLDRRKLAAVNYRLADEQGQWPTVEQLATETGFTTKRVELLQDLNQQIYGIRHLDAQLTADPSSSDWHEKIADSNPSAADPEESVLEAERADAVRQLIRTLEPLEQAVVASHFGIYGITIEDESIARLTKGKTSEQLESIRVAALGKLRDRLGVEPAEMTLPDDEPT